MTSSAFWIASAARGTSSALSSWPESSRTGRLHRPVRDGSNCWMRAYSPSAKTEGRDTLQSFRTTAPPFWETCPGRRELALEPMCIRRSINKIATWTSVQAIVKTLILRIRVGPNGLGGPAPAEFLKPHARGWYATGVDYRRAPRLAASRTARTTGQSTHRGFRMPLSEYRPTTNASTALVATSAVNVTQEMGLLRLIAVERKYPTAPASTSHCTVASVRRSQVDAATAAILLTFGDRLYQTHFGSVIEEEVNLATSSLILHSIPCASCCNVRRDRTGTK